MLLGIGPGEHPAAAAELRAGLEHGVEAGLAAVAEAFGTTEPVNGWVMHTDLGRYGDDVLLRAAIARGG